VTSPVELPRPPFLFRANNRVRYVCQRGDEIVFPTKKPTLVPGRFSFRARITLYATSTAIPVTVLRAAWKLIVVRLPFWNIIDGKKCYRLRTMSIKQKNTNSRRTGRRYFFPRHRLQRVLPPQPTHNNKHKNTHVRNII